MVWAVLQGSLQGHQNLENTSFMHTSALASRLLEDVILKEMAASTEMMNCLTDKSLN